MAEDGKERRNDPRPMDMEEYDRLKGLGVKDILEEARREAVMGLYLKVKAGDASAAELAVLRNLLRDNGMIMGFGDDNPQGPIQQIGFHLPDLEDDQD